jgi:hypothetical protein
MTRGSESRKPRPALDRSADGSSTLSEAVRTIRAESAGLLDLMVVRPADLAFVVAEATARDPDAVMVLAALDNAVQRISAAPRRSPMRCVACLRPLLARTHYSFCVVLPSRANPTSSLAIAVCSKCAVTPEEITAKGVLGLRQIWPDISSRPITVTHPTGGQA